MRQKKSCSISVNTEIYGERKSCPLFAYAEMYGEKNVCPKTTISHIGLQWGMPDFQCPISAYPEMYEEKNHARFPYIQNFKYTCRFFYFILNIFANTKIGL